MNSARQPTALVTGGGGFLGYAIVLQLLKKKTCVRTFSRRHYKSLDIKGVEQYQGDLDDLSAVTSACQEVDTVFHVAAKTGVWGRYNDYYKTNVIGTHNIIAACQSSGCTDIVYTSSPSVVFNGQDMEGVDESVPYPKHYRSHYPQTKALAEQAVVSAAKDGLKTIILRPHLIWGPRDNHLVPRIIKRAHRLRQIGDGNNLVDTVYIDNAASAHILAAESLKTNPELSGRIYFISQGDPIPLWDMVNAILKAGGRAPVKKIISLNKAKIVAAVLETIYRILRLKGEPQLTRFVAEELASSHWFDISAARKDLNYRPEVSTAVGLKRLQEWLENMPSARQLR
jgi:nucleoside-diphosphate-sugar epimerase